jgi:tRNA(fMet)-specific endonuclease VapC
VQLLRGLGAVGRLSISAITRLEVHAGMAAEERYATQKLLSRFVTYDLGGEIAGRAGDLIAEKGGQGTTLSVPDAIIAATAIVHNLALVTLNQAHFEAIPGLSLCPLAQAS